MTIQEKLKEAKDLNNSKDLAEKRITILEKEMFEELNSKFPILIQHKNDSQIYKSSELLNEIQLLLRSMIKRNEIIKIPMSKEKGYAPYPNYNLTVNHGLKWPRQHRDYDFLPNYYDRKVDINLFKMENLIYKAVNESIDFTVLKNNKLIDQKKLTKFSEFVVKTIELWKYFVQTDIIMKKKDPLFNDLPVISEFRNYWQDIEHYVKILDQIELLYSSYTERMTSFLKNQEDLLSQIRVFNKPYRVFLKLEQP